MTDYMIWLMDAFGQRVAIVPNDQIAKLSYVLNVNAVGVMTLTVPRNALPDSYIVKDAAMEIWRRPDGGTWQREGDTPWLITATTRGLDKGSRYRRIKAETANTLLGRRFVMYTYGGSTTSKSGHADDIMKDIVTENLGSSANNASSYNAGVPTPSRRWDTLISIDALTALGPSTTKVGFQLRNVLAVLQEVGRDATSLNLPTYFDIVYSGAAAAGLVFRTWVRVRGIDRIGLPITLVVSADRGSLGGTIEVTEDWSNVATWVVAGGQGQGGNRQLGSAFDNARIGLSRFGVSEYLLQDTSAPDTTTLASDASAELRARRPRKVLSGDLISVPGATYGVDWGWGDRLIAEFEDDTFYVRVDSVSVTLDRGRETIAAALSGET